MMKLTQILNEIKESTVIKEIGDTAKPYPYELITRSSRYGAYTYVFDTQRGDRYDIDFTFRDGELYSSFSANDSNLTTDNYKELFRVMNTISTITKEVVKDLDSTGKDVNYLTFDSSNTKGGARNPRKGTEQRDKLYYNYIKKAFPSAKQINPSKVQISEKKDCHCGCGGACSI